MSVQVLGNLAMGLAFVGMVLGLTIGWIVNLVARKRLVNPGTFAYVGVGLAAIIGFSMAGLVIARSTNPDPGKQGELVGSVVGGILIPLLITFFIHRSLKRRASAV